jgi:hypothetical protein
MSAYRIAIDRTKRTINARAECFRNMIIVVVAITLVSAGWAAVTRTLVSLTGPLLLFPVCGFFLFWDNELLSKWRSQLFAAWLVGDIDFRAFYDAVTAIPALPKETLRSMLATLPSPRDLVVEQKISSSTRRAVVAAVATTYACRSDKVALRAAGATILFGSAFAAAVARRWEPLLSCVVLVLLPLLGGLLKRRRTEGMKRKIAADQDRSDFNNESYMQLIASL